MADKRIPKGWVPRTLREQEQYFLAVSKKIGGTDAELSDEEQKSAIPFLGMVQDLRRQMTALQREGRRMADRTERAEQGQRRLEVELQQLKKRLRDVEGEL
jgi:uncharacterized protein involved in exopolysaccharide biosynthesis